jgi:membrane protease YdiL (CAAX protease family)
MKINHNDKSSGYERWILALLLLSIIISYAPNIIGCLVFIEGGFIEDNVILLDLLHLLSFILMITSVIGMWRITHVPRISMQWFGKKKISTVFGVIVLPIILITTNVMLMQIFNKLGIYVSNGIARYTGPYGNTLFLVQMIMAVLVAPIVEEFFWRGYVQGVIEKVYSRPIAVFGQAFLFALIHLVGIAGRFRVFVIGLILGFWRCRKRTLVPLIAAHMVFNSLVFIQILCNYFEERTIKVTHDYRKQLENLCRPADYIPEENALPYYMRAIELLVEPPDEFGDYAIKCPMICRMTRRFYYTIGFLLIIVP